MPTDHWLETYRGVVYRWEVDANDHLTVAYYMTRFADAAGAVLHALGVEPSPTTDCFIHYSRELRVNDLLHVESGVIGVEPDALVLGHKLFESTERGLCTTVEQRLAVALTPAQRAAAEARRVAWDGPKRERRPAPATLDRLRDAARDAVRPTEVDACGRLRLSAAVHRFTAANGHALAGIGMTPRYMREASRGFSTFEFQLGFEGGVREGDPLSVRSGLTHVGNSSIRILHVMTNERSGERVAALEQSGVHLDLDARRPAPLPPELRAQALTQLLPTG
jgi:acyl-CoA thioesterase FadM